MLPHSYTVDSQSKSQDLASSILSSTSSSQIISTCSSIDSFLLSHSPDQTRHFFSLAFPPLISKLFFGLTDSSSSSKPNPSNGWIDSVLSSNDPDSANAVFSLLSPSSILFHSISAVDRLSLVKYVFPIERLPQWTRFALSSNKFAQALSDLSPLFNSKLKHDPIKPSALQIQLNVFEYYLFWFAYYPICKSNSENSDSISIKRARKFRLENWTSSIPGFSNSKRGNEQRIECNLYLRLLYAYLRAFVPIHDLNAHQLYRSSLLHYACGYDGSVTMRAEFVVNAFVHFWLVDNDFSPLPVNVLKSHGVSFPFRSVLGDTPPPASGLGEVVKLFVKYLNLSSVAVTEDGGTENCGNPRWRVFNSGSFDGSGGGGSVAKSRDVAAPVRQAGLWNAWIQRPLYRFILRTFLFCPVGSSIKNASEVFDIWITYMEPWTITWNDFAELDAIVDGANKSERKEDFRSQGSNNGYSPSWQGYVLSNYLYYSSLVMHFIGFAHKFLHSDVEIIVRMVSKVMNILTSSKELVDLIKNVDTVFHSKQAGSGKSMLNSLCRFVPSIREQLQDWEDGLCESDADGSFLHENWNKDLRLFSNGEDGGQQLLQLFILRAEAELQAISGDNLADNLKCLDSLKAQVSRLFGGHTVRTLSFSPEPKQYSQSRDDIFKPRRVGNHASSEIKYRGDWMKRPISDDEVAWLAKLLVRFSAWLNESLGLNQAESSPAWSYVEVSTDVANVCGPTETMRAVLCAISSWLLTLAAVVLRLMKSHGLRVNLRMLASKKVVMVLILSAVFSVVKKAFGLFHRV